MIPNRIYKTIEYRLRNRHGAAEEARARLDRARSAAYDLRGIDYSAVRVQSSSTGDAMARRVQAITQAEQQLQEVNAWELAISRAENVFPPETPEGEVAMLIYDEKMSQAEACEELGIDRQTVRRRKDTFVGCVALYAADLGLIRGDLYAETAES